MQPVDIGRVLSVAWKTYRRVGFTAILPQAVHLVFAAGMWVALSDPDGVSRRVIENPTGPAYSESIRPWLI